MSDISGVEAHAHAVAWKCKKEEKKAAPVFGDGGYRPLLLGGIGCCWSPLSLTPRPLRDPAGWAKIAQGIKNRSIVFF